MSQTRHQVAAGATVFLPRGVPHTFGNPGPGQSKMLALLTPSGLEGYFDEVENLLGPGELDMEAVLRVAAKYGLKAVGPPLG